MELQIKKQEKRPLLSRTEILAEISFDGPTPSRKEIAESLVKKLKLNPELTAIKHIYTEFGVKNAEIEAFCYEDKKIMDVLEKSPRGAKPADKTEGQAQASDKKSSGDEE